MKGIKMGKLEPQVPQEETFFNYLLDVVKALKNGDEPPINEEFLEQAEEFLLGQI